MTFVQQLGPRIANLALWRDGDKCVLTAVLTLPFVLVWILRLTLVQQTPHQGPYLDPAAVGPMLAFVWLQALGYVAIAVLGRMVRGRSHRQSWLVHATIQFWFICFFLDLYAIGPYTSPFGMLLLVFPVLGFIAFGIRPMAIGLAVFAALLVVSTGAERQGLIPYAPLMLPEAFTGGRPHSSWILSLGVIPFLGSTLILAFFALVVVQWQDRERRLAELCQTDYLTGVDNRRSFMDNAETEFMRAQRYGKSLAVILVDVDHFKRVNDSHGHAIGDEVLKIVAKTLAGQMRRHDLAARYGGEEFALLLAETSQEEAQIVAERCRGLIESLALVRPGDVGEPVRVTVSLGIAALPHPGVDRIERLIDVADAALYRAKSEGRNRVAIAA
jgi:diguanylate cyclase (GGDEF)-like protein